MARALANESMVLLKNDGTLPLKPGPLKIALIGPLADQTKYLLGNYNGVPTHTVSVLEGLKAEFPEAQINFVPGTQFLRNDGDAVPASAFTTSKGQPGLKLEFATGEVFGGKPTILATRDVTTVDLKAEDVPQEATGKYPMRAEWNGFLTSTETGDYSIGVRFQAGFAKVVLDGNPVAQGWAGADDAGQAKVGHVHLEQGKKVSLKMQYSQAKAAPIRAQLIWSKYDPKPSPEAIAAARAADVVIAVLGITSELEGEEMPVSEEGFKGGDRTNIDLPKPEEELLEAVAATGKPVVLVRQRARRELGRGTRQCDSRALVCGRGRRRGNRGDSFRQKQSCRAPSSYVLHRRRAVAVVRRLRNEGAYLSLFRRQAPLSVWIRPELHDVLIQLSESSEERNRGGRSFHRGSEGYQHRQTRRR
jgi:beta-glucosidase